MRTLMYYYQTFVNAVRGVGGNNTNRWLVMQSVSDPSWMNALPTDTVTNRLMVEYHCYSPSQFAILSSNAGWDGCGTAYWEFLEDWGFSRSKEIVFQLLP